MKKLDFFEIVKINTTRNKEKKLNDMEGVVLAIGEENGEIDGYDVYVFQKEATYGFYPDELVSTGKKIKKEDFYDGTSIKVKVNEDGSGEML